MLRMPSRARLAATVTAAALAATVAAAPAGAAVSRPDIECQRAGLSTLRSAGLLDDVARGGLPIETALSLGVTVRPGADISGVKSPLKLAVILRDHRAGDQSLFIYPWCN